MTGSVFRTSVAFVTSIVICLSSWIQSGSIHWLHAITSFPFHMQLAYVLSSPRYLFNTRFPSVSNCKQLNHWEMVLERGWCRFATRNRSILSILQSTGTVLQYPISSWHFQLIVMTTDSMLLHWVLTGIDENNLLYVITDNIFYPCSLPSMTPRCCYTFAVIHSWPFGDTSLTQQFPYSDNSTFIDIGHSFIVTSSYNNGFPSHNASDLPFSFP